MSENINESLGEVITALADVFEKEAYENYVNNFKGKFNVDLNDIEKWNMYQYKEKEPQEQYIKEFFKNKGIIDSQSLYKLVFVYQHYNFLKYNIEKIVDVSTGCNADKSRFIIKSYIKHLSKEEFESFKERGKEGHVYHHPDFGDNSTWFKFIDSLQSLYYGYIDEYLKILNDLMQLRNTTLAEIKADNEIVKNYIPIYLQILEKNKDQFKDYQYEKLISKYYQVPPIYDLLNHLKQNTITEQIVVDKAKEYANKYFP